MTDLKSPFPYFGGKSVVADRVWRSFGNVANYVEPFFGSGAVLLSRPHEINGQVETVNDKDCMVSNFWRAVQADADAVAEHVDWPANENDLHARHAWLVGQKDDLRPHIEGDPDFYDARVAGWWCWGMSLWIGGGFCSGDGPWSVDNGKLLHLGDKGRGVKRQRLHLGNKGQGVSRKRLHLGDKGQGVSGWFCALQERLRRVRVCSGDWSRVCGTTPTEKFGEPIGVFLDPPYSVADRADCYVEECRDVAVAVRDWALDRGEDRRYRIALCGYDGEHDMPGWHKWEWKANGGYSSQGKEYNANPHRERIWFSPHTLAKDRHVQAEFSFSGYQW
jgi:hypothetical protein